MTDAAKKHAIYVEVAPRFLDDQSTPEDGRFAFAYSIRIHNEGQVAARLVARHWRITDGNGRVEQVDGEGVVGEQPVLEPGGTYTYTSGAMLETPVGSMRGSYQMVAEDGVHFEAEIPVFTLAVRSHLH